MRARWPRRRDQKNVYYFPGMARSNDGIDPSFFLHRARRNVASYLRRVNAPVARYPSRTASDQAPVSYFRSDMDLAKREGALL